MSFEKPQDCLHAGWKINEPYCPRCGASGWYGYFNEATKLRLLEVLNNKKTLDIELYDPTGPTGEVEGVYK